MPSLPRIRRTRARDLVVAPSAPPSLPAELTAAGLTWIHLDAPALPQALELAERFGWHALDVEDVMSKRQRPKIDDYADEGYLFGVLHFPIYDRASRRLNAAELDIFVGPNYLVTLPSVELLPVSRLFRRCEEDEQFREQLLSKGSGRLLYEVLDDLFDYCFPILDNYKEVVEALEDTNESVISHRQNDVLRVLTVFSVVLLPLTLITGFFGMNVRFPGFDTAWAFWVIFAGMVASLIALLSFFRYKRWL